MLTVKRLTELREIINLKAVCRIAGVNYYTVKNKTLAFKENPSKGELSENESLEIKKSIELKGLKLNEN
jgi:hypothetical protein